MTNLLSSLYATSTSTNAIAFLLSCSNQQRKKLAILAGLPDAWISCNQKIKENVDDLVNQIIEELYNPFLFYRSSLMSPTTQTHPAVLFQTKQATPPLRQKNSSSFWQAPSGIKTTPWLPSQTTSTTFDAVVHFVQGGSGTGVHIGNGKILTCSHVIDTRADEELIDIIPTRVGRQKLVMFSSGRVFITECAATCETLDGTQDVAIVVLGAEIPLQSLPTMTSNGNTIDLTDADESTDESESMTSLPFATVAKEAVKVGERLFCVGNPSSINLESIHPGTIEFSPPCFHVSVGYCEGYVDPVVNALNQEISDRGRAPTRGEKKKYMEAAGVIYENVEKGMFLKHSCWTYWGHSGAPLFNQAGEIVGLHNAWNDRTGIRHGQKLEYLVAVNMKCEEEAVVKTKKGKKKKKKSQAASSRTTKRRKT